MKSTKKTTRSKPPGLVLFPVFFKCEQPRHCLAQKSRIFIALQNVVDLADDGVWVVHALSSFRYFHYIQQLVVKQSAK
nr:MAG TPA: hypothetical protein [Caudoviricetes sp.]